MQAVAKWRTRSGIRRTSPTDTLSVDLEAYTSIRGEELGGEGGIAYVRFLTQVNGGPVLISDVAAPSMRFPNYSSQPSPLPGSIGGVTPLWAYGITLDCGALAGGTVVVTAEVHSVAGTITPVTGNVVLYNDADGVDRRPSTKRVFVSPTGNDANPGTEALPLLSIMTGVEACRANPAGSSAADCDGGGAELVLMPGVHQWARGHYGAASWHTSGAWWLTVTLQPGASIVRDVSAGTLVPEHYLSCTGFGATTTCRVHFVGGEWQASGGVLSCASGVYVDAWMDGAIVSSEHFDAVTKPYSVRFREDSSPPLTLDGPGSSLGRRFLSRTTVQGVTFGLAGWTDVHDFVVSNFLGVALQSTGDELSNSACNGLIQHQRYDDEVAGFVAFVGGANWTVSVPVTGQMRIDATSAQATNIATQLAEIAGTTYWGVKCSGFTASGNNTPAGGPPFAVLSTGTNGSGFPYVVLSNVNAVAGAAGASARLDTARYEAGQLQTYQELIHPDLHQWNTDRTETMHTNIAVRDVKAAQAWFTGSHTLTRCVVVNVSDGGNALRWNMADSTHLVDCMFFGCSTTGPWDFNSVVGCEFVDCVIAAHNTGLVEAGNYIDSCHFIAGTALGTNATSGAWYAGATNISPWHLTPDAGNFGTASSSLPRPAAWRFTGAVADSRGAWRNVAEIDWAMVPPSTGSAEGVFPLAGSAIGGVVTNGVAAGVLPLDGFAFSTSLFDGPKVAAFPARIAGGGALVVR